MARQSRTVERLEPVIRPNQPFPTLCTFLTLSLVAGACDSVASVGGKERDDGGSEWETEDPVF